jgi:hypothetical protein
MVLAPVAVTDKGGKTINGLKAQDFIVLDDHKPQQIVSFASDDAPCSVGMVLDTSGSMEKALPVAKDVANAFLRTSNPEDEFMRLTVSTLPDTVLSWRMLRPSINPGCENRRTDGPGRYRASRPEPDAQSFASATGDAGDLGRNG